MTYPSRQEEGKLFISEGRRVRMGYLPFSSDHLILVLPLFTPALSSELRLN